MKIYGREHGFKMTVGAAIEIAKLCPNGDLSKIGSILEGGYDAALMANVQIAAAMSQGYENAMRYEDPDYEANPLTMDELLSLDPQTLAEVLNEALAAFKIDQLTSVSIKGSKKKQST